MWVRALQTLGRAQLLSHWGPSLGDDALVFVLYLTTKGSKEADQVSLSLWSAFRYPICQLLDKSGNCSTWGFWGDFVNKFGKRRRGEKQTSCKSESVL
jgi:hypothetical protein